MSLREKSLPIKYVGESSYTTQLVRWILIPIGVWPKSARTSKAERILSDVLRIVCFFLLTFTMIPCAAYIILEEGSMIMKFKAVGPSSFWVMASLKYCSLILHQGNITRCLQRMEIDWEAVRNSEDRETMLRYAKVGRYMAGFCVVFMHSGVYSSHIVQALRTTVVYVGNDSFIVHMLPLPVYSGILDMRYKTVYQLTFAFELISTFVVNSITAGACSLAAVFVMHACGQLSVVMTWLEKLIDEHGPIQDKIADIVEHHLRILSFISVIEEILHQICFVELIGCTLNMCFLGEYFITEWQQNEPIGVLSYGIIFVSIAFNIFIFCYIGQILSDQCRIVGEAAYMTNWYYLPKDAILGIVLIITRSQCVVKITAGKLFQLSFSTFGAVIRTSVAYLNMLRQVMHVAD